MARGTANQARIYGEERAPGFSVIEARAEGVTGARDWGSACSPYKRADFAVHRPADPAREGKRRSLAREDQRCSPTRENQRRNTGRRGGAA